VSIIRMSDRTVTNVGLGGSIPTTGSGLRGAVPFNYEPEYIAVNKAGTKAWVTLQEHNAVATLDLTTNQFTGITGLGLKDYSLTQNAIDSTDACQSQGRLPARCGGELRDRRQDLPGHGQ
jgi:hypothetical protein